MLGLIMVLYLDSFYGDLVFHQVRPNAMMSTDWTKNSWKWFQSQFLLCYFFTLSLPRFVIFVCEFHDVLVIPMYMLIDASVIIVFQSEQERLKQESIIKQVCYWLASTIWFWLCLCVLFSGMTRELHAFVIAGALWWSLFHETDGGKCMWNDWTSSCYRQYHVRDKPW